LNASIYANWNPLLFLRNGASLKLDLSLLAAKTEELKLEHDKLKDAGYIVNSEPKKEALLPMTNIEVNTSGNRCTRQEAIFKAVKKRATEAKLRRKNKERTSLELVEGERELEISSLIEDSTSVSSQLSLPLSLSPLSISPKRSVETLYESTQHETGVRTIDMTADGRAEIIRDKRVLDIVIDTFFDSACGHSCAGQEDRSEVEITEIDSPSRLNIIEEFCCDTASNKDSTPERESCKDDDGYDDDDCEADFNAGDDRGHRGRERDAEARLVAIWTDRLGHDPSGRKIVRKDSLSGARKILRAHGENPNVCAWLGIKEDAPKVRARRHVKTLEMQGRLLSRTEEWLNGKTISEPQKFATRQQHLRSLDKPKGNARVRLDKKVLDTVSDCDHELCLP